MPHWTTLTCQSQDPGASWVIFIVWEWGFILTAGCLTDPGPVLQNPGPKHPQNGDVHTGQYDRPKMWSGACIPEEQS